MHASTTTAVSEGAFASLFQEMHDPAFLVDRVDGSFLAANQAAARFLGYSLDDLATLSPSDLHPHELPRLEAFLQEVTTHGRWQDDNLTCRYRDGSFVPAEARATTVHVQGRDCILIQLRDLRGQKLAEVGQSVRKLSHDLRNAMTTAQLLADRLAENDDAQVRKSADVIARSLERAIEEGDTTMSIVSAFYAAGSLFSQGRIREGLGALDRTDSQVRAGCEWGLHQQYLIKRGESFLTVAGRLPSPLPQPRLALREIPAALGMRLRATSLARAAYDELERDFGGGNGIHGARVDLGRGLLAGRTGRDRIRRARDVFAAQEAGELVDLAEKVL